MVLGSPAVGYTRFWGAHADPSLSHADMATGVQQLLAPMTAAVYGPEVLGYYNFVVAPETLRGRTPVEYAHLGYTSEKAYNDVRQKTDLVSQNYGPWHFQFKNLPEGHALKGWEGRPFFARTDGGTPPKTLSTSFQEGRLEGAMAREGYYFIGEVHGAALVGASYLARIVTKQEGQDSEAFLRSVGEYLKQEGLLDGYKARVLRVLEDSFIEYIYAENDAALLGLVGQNPLTQGVLQFSQIAQAVSAHDLREGRFTIDSVKGGAFRLDWGRADSDAATEGLAPVDKLGLLLAGASLADLMRVELF
ncbi:MAG: hypothetical protein HQM16_13280 [Deltaproteobacteria bacterium]|nr:hypothetical protein [Deltaproteobacteria bacterium]